MNINLISAKSMETRKERIKNMKFLMAKDLKDKRKHGVYCEYTDAIIPLVPYLKEQIEKAEDEVIIIKSKDIANIMGINFENKKPVTIYWGLKYSLFYQGICVETRTHRDGDKVLTMRMRTNDDELPESLLNR